MKKNMEDDDDMFVVIVKDKEESTFEIAQNSGSSSPVRIKDEELDSDEFEGLCTVLSIIEKAERNGHHLPVEIKEEPSDNEGYNEDYNVEYNAEYNEEYNMEYSEEYKEEYIEEYNEYVFDESNPPDDEFMYKKQEEDEEEDYNSDYKPKSNYHRHTMLKPSQRKSFVKDLRQQYPELANEKMLIKSLSEIMMSIKPPPPPLDYYIMNDIMLECVYCGALSETIPAAGRHYQEKHGERYLVCFACGVDFRSKTNLYKHEKRCLAPDAKVVLKARAQSVGSKGRSRPFLPKPGTIKPRVGLPLSCNIGRTKRPKKKKYCCTQCPAAFDNRRTLMSHELLHIGVRPFKCPECNCAYTSKEGLSKHAKKHTGVQYICDHCKRPFNVKAALIAHMNTHLPEKKFKCDECERRFASKFPLMLHVNKVHRNLPPPCACQICPKRYPRMSVLKDHMRRAHGMLLITRTMFLKKLPTLTTTQVEQAKVVTQSDLADFELQNNS